MLPHPCLSQDFLKAKTETLTHIHVYSVGDSECEGGTRKNEIR